MTTNEPGKPKNCGCGQTPCKKVVAAQKARAARGNRVFGMGEFVGAVADLTQPCRDSMGKIAQCPSPDPKES